MSVTKITNAALPAPPDLALTTHKNDARVDSRLLANHLGNQHRPVMVLIEKYAESFAAFGKVLF